MLDGGLGFDHLGKKLSDEPKGVGVADLELQGPTRDVHDHGVWIRMELCGDKGCGDETVRMDRTSTEVENTRTAWRFEPAAFVTRAPVRVLMTGIARTPEYLHNFVVNLPFFWVCGQTRPCK